MGPGSAAGEKELRQAIEPVFAVEPPIGSAVLGAVVHPIVGPDVVALRRAQSDAGAFAELQLASFGPSVGHLQPTLRARLGKSAQDSPRECVSCLRASAHSPRGTERDLDRTRIGVFQSNGVFSRCTLAVPHAPVFVSSVESTVPRHTWLQPPVCNFRSG